MVGEDIARRSAEVGYWIGREYWGRGIMVDAVRATTKYAFEVLDLVRVFAGEKVDAVLQSQRDDAMHRGPRRDYQTLARRIRRRPAGRHHQTHREAQGPQRSSGTRRG